MIYIFNGITAICSLPGYLCSAVGEACKGCGGACSGIFRGIGSVCDNCGSQVKHFMERPLSVYVVLSICVSAVTIFQANEDGERPRDCESTFLLVLQVFACINIIFAIYFQCQVWRAIMSSENHHLFIDGDHPTMTLAGATQRMGTFFRSATQGTGAGGGGRRSGAAGAPIEKFGVNPGKIIIPTKVVQDSFKKVFMEDLGVLLMFFALLGMCALSWMGPKTVDESADSSSSKPCRVDETTKSMGYLFFWFGAGYAVTYMKCGCCANKVTVDKDEMRQYCPEYGQVTMEAYPA